MAHVDLCYCQSNKKFEDCCGPYLHGLKIAETPEILMRSRYSAYVESDIKYIQDTYLDEEDDFDFEGTKRWADSSTWKGLTIKATDKGGAEDIEGTVDFVAYYQDENGKDCYHQEKSLFVKVEEKWFFKEGVNEILAPIEREGPKLGRNDPCHCGSGKKLKKCHG
ncbi:MAG: SEC-C motif-containing protein [Thermoproteota archaeon]|jgi:SEC-C motif-containing protein